MGLPQTAVKRPVTMLMIFMAVTLLGVVSLSRLPVELMPNAAYHKITILCNIRGGMPPTDVEYMVTRPIEKRNQHGQLPGKRWIHL